MDHNIDNTIHYSRFPNGFEDGTVAFLPMPAGVLPKVPDQVPYSLTPNSVLSFKTGDTIEYSRFPDGFEDGAVTFLPRPTGILQQIPFYQ